MSLRRFAEGKNSTQRNQHSLYDDCVLTCRNRAAAIIYALPLLFVACIAYSAEEQFVGTWTGHKVVQETLGDTLGYSPPPVGAIVPFTIRFAIDDSSRLVIELFDDYDLAEVDHVQHVLLLEDILYLNIVFNVEYDLFTLAPVEIAQILQLRMTNSQVGTLIGDYQFLVTDYDETGTTMIGTRVNNRSRIVLTKEEE